MNTERRPEFGESFSIVSTAPFRWLVNEDGRRTLQYLQKRLYESGLGEYVWADVPEEKS